MSRIPQLIVFAIALAALALSGCAAKKPAEVPLKVYWPPPPAQPKMEWITTFSSEDNFPKTEGQKLADNFLGKKVEEFFKKPQGIATDSRGLIYVADMDVRNIRVIDFGNKTMSLYADESPIALPIGLAIDSRDNLYVTEGYNSYVAVFDQRRKPLRRIGGKDSLVKPVAMALDEANDRIYVSDVAAHKVVVFRLSSGAKLFEFGGKGGGKGQLYGPQGIAIDREGRIFVAEQFNARVQVFDSEGQSLYMFGKRGDRNFEFEGPRGLAIDSAGNVFVAEGRKAAVLVFSPDGEPLTALGGGRTAHQLGFTLPTAIHIDRNDRVYISDSMNRRITIWQMLTPAYLAEHPLNQQVLKQLEERVRQLQREREEKSP
jgi:sugar lactone lactonase YvrE